jgi:hypothetical protein
MALKSDMEAFSGNDLTLEVTATDQDGSALDLSGAQALIYAIGKSATGGALITKGLGSGVTVTDAAGGVLEVALSADDLEPLNGAYYHELRLTNAAGKKSTLLYGAVTVSPNLVRN